MFGTTFFRVLAAIALVAVMVGIGAYVYDAGFSAGVAEAARQAAASGDPAEVIHPGAYRYGWGWGGGFGFGPFAILFWILGVFLIIGLVRAAFGFGRRGGGGWGGPGGYGGRERVEEWHRQLHERADATEPGS